MRDGSSFPFPHSRKCVINQYALNENSRTGEWFFFPQSVCCWTPMAIFQFKICLEDLHGSWGFIWSRKSNFRRRLYNQKLELKKREGTLFERGWIVVNAFISTSFMCMEALLHSSLVQLSFVLLTCMSNIKFTSPSIIGGIMLEFLGAISHDLSWSLLRALSLCSVKDAVIVGGRRSISSWCERHSMLVWLVIM